MNRRLRLAVTITAAVLGAAAVVVLVTVGLATWRAADPAATTRAGAAQTSNGVTVLLVQSQGSAGAASTARHDTFNWLFLALGITVLPALGASWLVSGKMLRSVDEALAEGERREEERRRRLDEVIHELRTPLAVAGTNLELAADDPLLDAETAGLIDAARRAAERMRRTVDDLAEHGMLAVDRSGTVDLAAEVRAAAAEHAGPARARAIAIRPLADGSLRVPAGDGGAVRTALGNLVSNAVRLAPRGSTITLSCGEVAGWAWAAVGDEGPGLPAHEHSLVFDRGWRGRHDRDRDREGRGGLGLTIARQLTEANGGHITVESEEGAGSTFTIWLPIDDDAASADVVDGDHLHPVQRPWASRSATAGV